MFQQTNASRRSRARCGAQQRGQSIVVALLVLLLLGLAGALFVTIVARNVLNAQHANRVVTADQYARAGLTFADSQLSNTLDGADWRPPLQWQLANPPTEAHELARYNAAVAANALMAPSQQDPDFAYLQAGFARYNTGAGRFLLRVTYTPVLLRDTATSPYYDPVTKTDPTGAEIPVAIPPGKYLKIESIGREGVIDPQDPTTFANNRSSDRTQAYQVAYKPIAITDYAKFETNLQNRADFANIGVASTFYPTNTDGGIATPGAYDFNNPTATSVPLQEYPVVTIYGAPDAYKISGSSLIPNPTAGTATSVTSGSALPGGGSFHANMPVRFFGENIIYLNDAGANAPLYQDTVEVAGDLLLNGYTQANPLFSTTVGGSGQRSALILNPSDLSNVSSGASTTDTTNNNATANAYIVPSNDNPAAGSAHGGFSTHGGLVRDGSSGTDINGQPRSVGRLEPPLMDATDSGSQLPRYKALATLSPPRNQPGTTTAYPTGSSLYGYGQSIYINNVDDIQGNSKTIGGGSTLVDEWLNRTQPVSGNTKSGWARGDFYDPPGVTITLGRQNVSGPNSAYGFRMTRTDGAWPNTDGTPGTSATQIVLFDDISASNDPTATGKPNPDNDVLIYAEGNVRVHGIVSADPLDTDTTLTTADKYPRHVTIVTNGTAYIEGSLLKGNSDSSITVLAHDYVCVNTTQFFAGPQIDENPIGTTPPAGNSDPNYHALLFGSDETRLIQDLTIGLPNGGMPATSYAAAGSGLLGLYVSGRPGSPGLTQADFDIVNPATGRSIRQPVAGVSPIPFGTDGTGATSVQNVTFDPSNTLPVPANSAKQYFSLTGVNATDYSLNTPTPLTNLVESDTRQLHVRRDPSNPGATQDLELERVAVMPSDVRIEAVLYAQTGSFFVIPGPWFNSDSSDNLNAFETTFAANAPGGQRLGGTYHHFPFYGQPIDMKITIDGAVSEAQPADVANQTAWMLKWGWIPQYHGYVSQDGSASGPPLETAGHVLVTATNAPANKPAIGLQIIYNPQAGYPYDPGNGAADPPHYLRTDQYGRPLPFSPKLPVSTALLYAGESSEPPLLQ